MITSRLLRLLSLWVVISLPLAYARIAGASFHPLSNPYPHGLSSVRVEGAVDLSGPFRVQGTRTAMGAFLW